MKYDFSITEADTSVVFTLNGNEICRLPKDEWGLLIAKTDTISSEPGFSDQELSEVSDIDKLANAAQQKKGGLKNHSLRTHFHQFDGISQLQLSDDDFVQVNGELGSAPYTDAVNGKL